MTAPIRLLHLGEVSPLRSQALYHGLAASMDEQSPDTIVLCRPAAAYFCVGYHQAPGEELDLEWCRQQGYPVFHRKIGGGTVFLDSDQLFYQCVFHRSRAPFDVASTYRRFLGPPVAALRRLGLDARLSGVNEVEIGSRRIAGTGGGQIGEAVVVVGNVLFNFPHEVMAHAWRVPSPAFRRLAVAGLGRHLTTLGREMAPPPSVDAVARLLVAAYRERLGRALVPRELTAAESAAVERAGGTLALDGHEGRGGPREMLKITHRVAVYEWTWATPTGQVRVTARVADGRIEDLVLSGDGTLERDEAERRIRSALLTGSGR